MISKPHLLPDDWTLLRRVSLRAQNLLLNVPIGTEPIVLTDGEGEPEDYSFNRVLHPSDWAWLTYKDSANGFQHKRWVLDIPLTYGKLAIVVQRRELKGLFGSDEAIDTLVNVVCDKGTQALWQAQGNLVLHPSGTVQYSLGVGGRTNVAFLLYEDGKPRITKERQPI